MSDAAVDRGPRVVAADRAGTRHDRARLVVFSADAKTETVLREALAEAQAGAGDFHRGGIRQAIAALRRMPSPQALIVDLSDDDDALTRLAELAELVEPSVHVLAIGRNAGVDFYREVTRGLGVLEYLPKPIDRDTVRRHFLPHFVDAPVPRETITAGRAISITGSRGGVGATTIAANLAWHFGVKASRHTVLLDPDLHLGSAAMLLDTPTGNGLRAALEVPERIDTLFVERAATPVAERLHVLAGEVQLGERIAYAKDCAATLLDALCARYAVVIADTPSQALPLYDDLRDQAHQRVIVAIPTLASLRDTRRLMARPQGPGQRGRALVVLNRVGLRGGLRRSQVEDALGLKVDVTIPDLPRLVENAASMGVSSANGRNPFARAMAELARQTAYVRLLDSPLADTAPPRSRAWWRLS
jgi:pilus assembly protein CpaE